MAGYIGANTSSVTNNQNAAERRKKFTFTANTTVLSGLNFAPEKIHIFHNGIRLVRTTDYTEAADGKSVTLVNAAQAGDEVVAVTFAQDPASNAGYTDADVDAHLLTAGVTLDATNDRVGFGDTSPDNHLNVKESALSGRGASNGNTSMTLEHATDTGIQFFSANQTQIRFGDAASTGAGSIIYKHSDDSLRVSTNGSERMKITEDGHITTPSQPIFSANRSGKSNLTAAQVIDWTAIANQGNHFSTSTNQFTCPIAGKYYCSFYSLTHTTNTSAASAVRIRKNGTNIFDAYNDTVSSVNYLSYSAAGLLDCAANDIIDFYNSSGNVYGGTYSGAVIYLVG